MYKLIIVDDEEDIRQGLKARIQYKLLDISIVGAAEDAEEALVLVDKFNPELVIADVNMPGMNGLDMAKQIMELSPATRVIMLSGYDDYKYVSEALRNKIFDYLLKPVDTSVLNNTLKRAIDNITDEAKSLRNVQLLKKQLESSIPLLHEKCIYYLLSGYMTFKDIKNYYPYIDFKIDGRQTVCISIFLKNIKNLSDMKSFQLDIIGIKDMIRKLVSEYGSGEITDFSTNCIGMILSLDSLITQRELFEKMFSLSNNIVSKVLSIYGREIKIGIGSIYKDSTGIASSFKEALSAAEYDMVSEKTHIQFYTDITLEVNQGVYALYPLKDEDLIISAIKNGDVEKTREHTDIFLKGILIIKGLSFQRYKSFLMRLVYTVLRKISEWDIPLDILEEYNEPVEYRLRASKDVSDIDKVLKGFISYVAISINEKMSRSRNSLIENACMFMEQNFCSDIGIQEVADHVHLTPAYFSALFKKTLGKTAQEYLTMLRLEKAKQLILDGKAKVFEAAELVGYSDIHYFIRIYKKQFGVTPGKDK